MRWQQGWNYIFMLLMLNSALSSPVGKQVSLYNSTDHVTVFDAATFYDGLHGKQHACLLQFYSSYCGHCISFAPLFKEFAKNISDWSHTIQLGVLNCAVEENTGLCREYEVFGYPTIILLPANTSKGNLGKQLPTARTTPDLRSSIITYLVEQQAAGNGSDTWANLLPFSGSADELFSSARPAQTEAVVFIDREGSTMAQEALMDIGYFNELIIARWMVNGTGSLLHDVFLSQLPAIVLLNLQDKQPRLLYQEFPTVSSLVTAAMSKLGLEPEILPSYRIQQDENAAAEEEQGAGDGNDGVDDKQVAEPILAAGANDAADQLNMDRLNYDDGQPDNYYNPHPSSSDQVFLVDVENALNFALTQEVSLHKRISGPRLEALKQFLSVLVKYLPTRPKVHAYLSDLSKNVASYTDSMGISEYNHALERAGGHGILPDQQPWVGCKGTESHLRGFPCSMWVTFHLLTVNVAANADQNSDPLETLRAIHAFVKYFFSCTHCSQHFQEMFALDAETMIKSHDDSIMWLWKGHNEVNKRIAGDASEDRKHPKVQFPPKTLCPKCWSEDNNTESFKLSEVLQYLKKIYAKDSISLQNVARQGKSLNIASNNNNNNNSVLSYNSGNSKQLNPRHGIRISDTIYDHESDERSQGSFFQGLSEISTCMILYSATTLLVAAVYFGFLIRKRMKRKRFIEMYKNPLNAGDHVDVAPLRA
uniref:Sulfhydryl oxidase n=2 Tax=Hirondellea gigas TaxID=1518452 RepID=A0A2P2I507_9CRUS